MPLKFHTQNISWDQLNKIGLYFTYSEPVPTTAALCENLSENLYITLSTTHVTLYKFRYKSMRLIHKFQKGNKFNFYFTFQFEAFKIDVLFISSFYNLKYYFYWTKIVCAAVNFEQFIICKCLLLICYAYYTAMLMHFEKLCNVGTPT